VAEERETRLSYFGLVPEFIGRGYGAYLLQAAIDCAWLRPIARLWLTTSHFDHPKALRLYQRAGFVVYAQRRVRFEDPRLQGFLPRSLSHPLLPPLEPLAPEHR
jgi:GNAT superfamily N-acetyltransferase